MPPYFVRSCRFSPALVSATEGCPNESSSRSTVSRWNMKVGARATVIFIHGALMGDTYRPLMLEDALRDYRFIGYHRRGYTAEQPTGRVSLWSRIMPPTAWRSCGSSTPCQPMS